MKRRIISILCSVLIVFSMVGNLPAYAIYQEDYYVTVVRCNVRSTASTNGTILETVNAGTLKKDYECNCAPEVWNYCPASWTKVFQGNGFGFIRNDLICPLLQAYYVGTPSGINLRTNPYLSATIIGGLSQNTIVATRTFMEMHDNIIWSYVVVMTGPYEGEYGWVAYDYLSTYAH